MKIMNSKIHLLLLLCGLCCVNNHGFCLKRKVTINKGSVRYNNNQSELTFPSLSHSNQTKSSLQKSQETKPTKNNSSMHTTTPKILHHTSTQLKSFSSKQKIIQQSQAQIKTQQIVHSTNQTKHTSVSSIEYANNFYTPKTKLKVLKPTLSDDDFYKRCIESTQVPIPDSNPICFDEKVRIKTENIQTKNTSGKDNSCMLHSLISTINGLGIPTDFQSNPIYSKYKNNTDYKTDIEKFARFLRDQMIECWERETKPGGAFHENTDLSYMQHDKYQHVLADTLKSFPEGNNNTNQRQDTKESIIADLKGNHMLSCEAHLYLLMFVWYQLTGEKIRVYTHTHLTVLEEVCVSDTYTSLNINDMVPYDRVMVIYYKGDGDNFGHFEAYEFNNKGSN